MIVLPVVEPIEHYTALAHKQISDVHNNLRAGQINKLAVTVSPGWSRAELG